MELIAKARAGEGPGGARFALGEEIWLDLATLIETRLIIQANSGGGKSYVLRRALEQSHGQVQQLIVDVEGAFRTLRERYEYVLVGAPTDEVDYPITEENAGQLARVFLETGTSAIVDVYEYPMSVRQQIVATFLEALVDAPKPLWHDVLVVIDEAHVFSPEHKNPVSKAAVEALCSRGRARGYCAVLATQRIAKLSKDALGECNNKLIGRTSLDVDLKRGNLILEFPTRSKQLEQLEPGEFYALGPAFSFSGVRKIQVGAVLTTHPKAGSRRQGLILNPPPPASLSAVLAQLRQLPVPGELDTSESEREGTGGKQGGRGLSGERRPRRTAAALPAETEGEGNAEIRRLRALLGEREAEIQRLRAQVELLEKIQVFLDGASFPLTDLPAALHLDGPTIRVEQATIAVERLAGEEGTLLRVASVVGAPQEGIVPQETGGPVAAPALLFSEEKTLGQLLRMVRNLSASEKQLFTWLLEHDGKPVASQDLADAVGLDLRVTWSGRTSALLKIPFIKRTGSKKFYYQSTFGPYAGRAFSSVHDLAPVRQRLVLAAQS